LKSSEKTYENSEQLAVMGLNREPAPPCRRLLRLFWAASLQKRILEWRPAVFAVVELSRSFNWAWRVA
jgi:hypothetical protein